MCGRITIRTPLADIARDFAALLTPDLFFNLQPENVCPGQTIPVVRLSEEGGREIAGCHWGLIPRWSTDGKTPGSTINARFETASSLPTYRAAWQQRRCLIPVDGFYESKGFRASKRTPYFIHWKDDHLFGIAGLWERWYDASGHALDSCTILTTTPNSVVATVHDRMPVILNPRDYNAWLDPATAGQKLMGLMKPFSPRGMEVLQVRSMGSLAPSTESAGLFG